MTQIINHDTVAKLLRLTPDGLNDLVERGIIARIGSDQYDIDGISKFIEFLQCFDDRLASNSELAIHLDMSDRNVRELVQRGVFNFSNQTRKECRAAYIRHLREMAAGRSGTGELNLVDEGARLKRAQSERIEMQNAVTRREYGPIEALEQGLSDCMARVAAQLDTIPGKLRIASDVLTADDLDRVAEVIAMVRNDIADMEIDWFGDKENATDDDLSALSVDD